MPCITFGGDKILGAKKAAVTGVPIGTSPICPICYDGYVEQWHEQQQRLAAGGVGRSAVRSKRARGDVTRAAAAALKDDGEKRAPPPVPKPSDAKATSAH